MESNDPPIEIPVVAAAAPPTSPRVDMPTNGAVSTQQSPAGATVASRPRGRRRLILLPIVFIVLAVGTYLGVGFYRDGLLYVSTDNAQLTGTPVQVGPTAAGRVLSISPSVG
ncbi:MAG TPA: hypothetical protein VGK54_19090, partial [Chloroflexota bacterium]